MRSESIIAVQTVLAGGKEAELRFRASSMRQDDGALSLWDRPDPDGPERMIMAFAPAAWRGAWVVDSATSYPVGLELDSAPSSRPASPLREAPARSPSPAPASAPPQSPSSQAQAPAAAPVVFSAAEPAWPESYQPAPSSSAPSAAQAAPQAPAPLASTPEALAPSASASPWAALERDARVALLAQALAGAAYEGLPALAERLSAPVEEVEQALAAAVAQRKVDLQLVQDPALQTLMDQVNPDLIRTHRPKKPGEILDLLRQRDDTAAVDLVQLRVWLLRNPPKRPA